MYPCWSIVRLRYNQPVGFFCIRLLSTAIAASSNYWILLAGNAPCVVEGKRIVSSMACLRVNWWEHWVSLVTVGVHSKARLWIWRLLELCLSDGISTIETAIGFLSRKHGSVKTSTNNKRKENKMTWLDTLFKHGNRWKVHLVNPQLVHYKDNKKNFFF